MTTESLEQQDLMVVISPVPQYQVQIIPSDSTVTVAPVEVRVVNDLSSYVSRAQFAESAITASYAEFVSGSIESASYAEFATTASYVETDSVVFSHASGSIIYTGSLAEGIFAVSETVYTAPTSSYSAALVEYVAERVGGLRVGQLMATWIEGTVQFTDISSIDIGNADDISFNVYLNGGNVSFRVNSVGSGSYGWTVQSVFKLFPRLT